MILLGFSEFLIAKPSCVDLYKGQTGPSDAFTC